jgi:hypothetical protein
LALWGRRHGLGPVIRALLNGGADHVLLAASLLAEGGEVPERLADETVDRVFGLAALVPDGDRLERLLLRMAEPGTPCSSRASGRTTSSRRGRKSSWRPQPKTPDA